LADALPAVAGTAGQLLSTGGLGAPMAWVNSAGGAWEFVSTTVSGSDGNAVDITGLDGTAEAWLIRFNLWFVLTGDALGIRVRSGGSFITASEYRYHVSAPRDGASGYSGLNSAGDDVWRVPNITTTNEQSRPITGELMIFDPAATTHRKIMTMNMGHYDNGQQTRHVTSHCAWNGGDGAIDQIRFFGQTTLPADIAMGATFHLYKRVAA
jgi:hypothetical protein